MSFNPQLATYHAYSISPVENAVAVLFHGVATLFMTFVLRIFLVVYIILTYASLNAYAKHMEGVPQVGMYHRI